MPVSASSFIIFVPPSSRTLDLPGDNTCDVSPNSRGERDILPAR